MQNFRSIAAIVIAGTFAARIQMALGTSGPITCPTSGRVIQRATRRSLRWLQTILVFTAIVAIPSFCRAAKLLVCPGGTFTTIQSAVNAANPGDTVQVCAGSYPEQVMITKTLKVQGLAVGNANAVVILPPVNGLVANTTETSGARLPEAAQVLVQTPKGEGGSIEVRLRNLTIDGIGNKVTGCVPRVTGVLYQNASGTIAQVEARNQVLSASLIGCQSGFGLRVESSDDAPGLAAVTVQDSTVHDYQKDGITAIGTDTAVQISRNTIRGQGPTNGAAENGIEVGAGASGIIMNNQVIDNVWAPDTINDPADAATGILIFAASSVTVTGNMVGNSQFGIATGTSPSSPADNTVIHRNTIFGTRIFDGIELCSNNNTVTNNVVASSDEAGVHTDSRCGGTGNGNKINTNTINSACAGILEGSGTSGNAVSSNVFLNVTNIVLNANQCLR
jgi:Right handed beta helix region